MLVCKPRRINPMYELGFSMAFAGDTGYSKYACDLAFISGFNHGVRILHDLETYADDE